MHPIWKPLAFISLATVGALAGLLLYVSFREGDTTARMRRNVTEQIRFYLDQKEPAKAASALDSGGGGLLDPFEENAFRLEIARGSDGEAAALILDGLILPAMDRRQAAEAAQTRLDLQRRLFESAVLREGALPAPFEPAAFRMARPAAASIEEMRKITSRLESLVTERRELARRAGEAEDPELARTAQLAAAARYALGELPYEEVKVDDRDVRVRFGDLLYRERQFDRAIETWRPVLDDPRVIWRIAELAALRKFAPRTLRVWDFDVEQHLGKDPAREAQVLQAVEERFKNARPGQLPLRRGIPRDVAPTLAGDEPMTFSPDAEPGPTVELALDPTQIYLLVHHRQFDFQNVFDRPFLTRADPQLQLRSAYSGPIRFRLFKVRDLATLVALDAETIASRRSELQPLREWQRQFAPLAPNDGPEAEWRVDLPSCPAGLYVLMADARYCPVYAFARLIVTDTGLLQHPALDRVLVHSVDRVSGAPVPGLALEGDVTGSYVLQPADLLPRDDSNVEEFRRGFDAAWGGKASEAEASPGYTQGYQSALALRASKPDVKTSFRGTTDKDGLFDWTVTPAWKEGYQYAIRTTSRDGGTCTRVDSSYALGGAETQQLALVYADRPLYRAGETVSFKALLRRRDGEGLQPYEGREALIEIGSGGRTITARSHPVTDFGSASGALDLPEECARGAYWVRVNNGAQQPLFKVEDYRKPEFELSFTHAKKVRAGDAVDVAIQARRFSGEPLAKTRVTLSVQSAAGMSTIHLMDEWGTPVRSARPEWRPIEERVVTTDEEGRAQVRIQTEEGVAARYVVGARASEESGREVSQSSGFEAAGQARQVLVETDRPVYFPGETAKIRLRVPAATAARVEERAKLQNGFSISVALQDGAGGCEYVVPEIDRVLSVGVREGEGWTWTRIPLRIQARPAAGALVNVRLDRPLYRVGETAKAEITTTDPNTSVLLLVATGKIHRRQVLRVTDRKIEVPIEVRDEDIPNVHLVAVTVRNDHVAKATAALQVPPIDRFLTVEVATDRPDYAPGQECRATLRVTDAQGRPVPDCELSLGVIDESIYALQEDRTPDLRAYFHQYSRPLRVHDAFFYKEALPPFTVWKVPVFVKGQRDFYETMGVGMGGGGGGRYGGRFGGRENLVARGGGSMATSRRSARSDFRDTAHWSAHLRTGADGVATTTFAFPENLTRFRFTARGITKAHQVGEVRHEAVVRKPFFVTLAAPRVLQEGNAIVVSGIVHNRTEQAQLARVSLTSPLPTLATTAPAQIPLPPGASSRVEYLLSVDRPLAEVPITFGAECDSGESDALTLRIPGRRHGSPFHDGRSGSVAAGAPREEVFRIPAGAIPGTVSLTVDVDAGIHTAIAGALEPLIEYPYGCVEQTMSRFLPAVAARRAMGEVPPRFREKVPQVLAAGLQRLYALQQPDGGWGWWSGDPVNPSLTAYVLYGLATCKKAGVGVDRSVAERAAKQLAERLAKSVFESAPEASRLPLRTRLDLRAYELLALAEHHAVWGTPSVRARQLIGTMIDRTEGLGPTDRVLLALAAARVGLNDAADRILKDWEGRDPGDVATASFLLQLRAARGADVAPTVRFLLARRTGRGWANTIESAHALLGLAAAVERPNPAMDLAPGRFEIRVNGDVVQELQLRGAADPAFDGRISIPAPAGGWGEKAVVRLSFDGQGTAFFTASLDAALGGEDRPAVSRGFEIRREYFERTPAGWQPVDGPVAAGRAVLVVLTISTSEPRDYLMVTDPRPDGFEPIDYWANPGNDSWNLAAGLSDKVDLERGWETRLDEFRRGVRGDPARESAWAKALLREIVEQRRFVPLLREGRAAFHPPAQAAHVEQRDDRTIFFVGSLRPGTHSLWYVARAELAGRTHALPPRIEAMYEPELHASGIETRLEVADGRLVRSAGRAVRNAEGVDGLLEILPHLGEVDADALIARLPSNPRIGDLLVSVCSDAALRRWLSRSSATASSGRDLRERVDAARQDLAVRRLAVDGLAGAPRERLPALEAALGDDALAALVLRGADASTFAAADNLLLWSMEDRRFRLDLLAAAQALRGSARIDVPSFPALGLPRVAAALGASAPKGAELLGWKLGQRARFGGGGLRSLAAVVERDLGLQVHILGPEDPELPAIEGTISSILDQSLSSFKLFYQIRDGEVVIGKLEDLLR